jgi:hypothetical protein
VFLFVLRFRAFRSKGKGGLETPQGLQKIPCRKLFKKELRTNKESFKGLNKNPMSFFFEDFLSRFLAFVWSKKTIQIFSPKKSHKSHFFNAPPYITSPLPPATPWGGQQTSMVRNGEWHPHPRCGRNTRGRQFFFDGPPRTFAKSQTHPPTIRLFLFLTFF